MNANTLADELDDIDAYEKHQTLLGKASEMLRQQQAEIEALKDKLSLWEAIGRQIANNDNQGTS